MKYIISYTKPHNHFIDIEFIAKEINQEELFIQLPAWRPGRYELGNFAKNVREWAAYDGKGNKLKFEKSTKDCWKVYTKGIPEVHIRYNYYAAEINAGSTFLDSSQLYMNPVNCCVYIPERINESCELILQLPENFKVAGALKPWAENNRVGERSFIFRDFHELADSPFIASNSLQHTNFVCDGVEFNLWFQGECKPSWSKLNNDFLKLCKIQLEVMGKASFERYHFLFQILPNKMYHGVEHTCSTVIALGPGYNLMKDNLYEDLLGVSCHELFHAWNVKTIRPVEMHPYDYTRENYSKLGYVCEGVTTYYGDYLLFRSGIFNEEQYFQTFAKHLQKHFDNFGRSNLSVADSSFDTWLDGYNPGIPNRKTSIYDEGCLLAFITDIFIRRNSNNEHCLDHVMRFLFNEFALKGKGYSDLDYKGIVEHFAGASYDELFNNYINGTYNYEPLLQDALNFIGYELIMSLPAKFHEHGLGIKILEAQGVCKIIAVYPDSVADIAGIAINDELLSVNSMQIKSDVTGTNFTDWCNYFNNTLLELIVATSGEIKQIEIIPQPAAYYKLVLTQKQKLATEVQLHNFDQWKNQKTSQ